MTTTDTQTAAVSSHVDRWVDWGLSTEPADRDQVEDGMRRCYELAGLAWHGRVVWVDSPYAVALAGLATVPPRVPVWVSTRRRRRLHSDDGPAAAWRDGWTLHYRHGVLTPET